MLGCVAIVLHAHLPYVRHPEHARPLEERWLHEALWESYLPLVELLERLAGEGVTAPLTVSVSPPLASMLDDELLRARHVEHMERLAELAAREARRLSNDARFGPVAGFYCGRIAAVRAVWDRIGGDVLGALARLEDAGLVELATTSASHAYLPQLGSERAVEAQLVLGRRAFGALAGRTPLGLWLPECGYEPGIERALGRAGVGYTVLDAHGLLLAEPAPALGIHAPILAPTGAAFFGRDPDASREVWSRKLGYPGDARYREFYRDIGFDRPVSDLAGEVGPHGTRVMTGLKYHRITGPGPEKAPYEPHVAAELASRHAADFVARRERALSAAPRAFGQPPIAVAPYDAELFGHWWFEGPDFLEAVLRALHASARAGRLEAVTLGQYLARHPHAFVAQPAASSWGRGGFGAVWSGPSTAHLLRPQRHAERAVRACLTRHGHATGVSGSALDQAIVELLLLQSSDWAFMIAEDETADYAESRLRGHFRRALRLAELAAAPALGDDDAAWVAQARSRMPFLSQLGSEPLRSAFAAET